jgi:hypothetical protein
MSFLPTGSEVGLPSLMLEGAAIFVVRGMPDISLPAAAEREIRIPADAFAHTDPNAPVVLEATLADGRPLPAWIVFDPASGAFKVMPPPGLQEEIEVRVIARDAQGREAMLTFTISVGKPLQSGLEGRSGLNEQLRMAARPLGVSERLHALSRAAQAAQRTRG